MLQTPEVHEAIDSAMEKINTAWTAASEEIYKASQDEAANSENVDSNYYDDQEELIFKQSNDIKSLIESLEKTTDEIQS